MKTKEFKFNDQTVNFEVENKNVIVNATEMANVFDKKCIEFTDLKNTQELVKKLIEKEKLKLKNDEKNYFQSGNSHFENEEKLDFEDEFTPKGKFVKVVRGGKNSGTWMDRRIAIAFAMWLDAEFYLWVVTIIDEIMFGEFSELEININKTAKRKAKIKYLRDDIKNNPPSDERVVELLELEDEDKKESRKPFSEIGRKVKDRYKQLIIKFQEEQKADA